jgi:2-polyprenyl-3-methyl-5-hydroxy-6-metoxy-1,4-benzoquinol methylase
MKRSYIPSEYWEKRLSTNGLTLATVGYSGLGFIYNSWLYRARFSALNRILKKLKVPVSNSKILDVGVGSGAYISFWQKRGIQYITGIDITDISVNTLKDKYPSYRFIKNDITRNDFDGLAEQYDIITSFDVLFHVVDDIGFQTAIANLSKLIKSDGWLIISDSFCDNPWGPLFHEYHRTLIYYQTELERNNFVVKHIEPIFYTMTTPLCGNKLMVFLSKTLNQLIVILNKISWTRWFIHLIGALLYSIDYLLGYLLPSGPSLKYLIAQKLISSSDLIE